MEGDMKKRNLILGLGLSVFLASAGMAGATCVQDGKVARLRSGTTSNGPGAFVDLGPSISGTVNFPTFYVFYAIPTDRFVSMLASAAASHVQVELTGDAASCPTIGVFRNGGNLIGVDLRVNQYA